MGNLDTWIRSIEDKNSDQTTRNLPTAEDGTPCGELPIEFPAVIQHGTTVRVVLLLFRECASNFRAIQPRVTTAGQE